MILLTKYDFCIVFEIHCIFHIYSISHPGQGRSTVCYLSEVPAASQAFQVQAASPGGGEAAQRKTETDSEPGGQGLGVPREKPFRPTPWAEIQAPGFRGPSLPRRSPSAPLPTAPRHTHFPPGPSPLPPAPLPQLLPAAARGEFTAPRLLRVSLLATKTSADAHTYLPAKRRGFLNAVPARTRTSHGKFSPSRASAPPTYCACAGASESGEVRIRAEERGSSQLCSELVSRVSTRGPLLVAVLFFCFVSFSFLKAVPSGETVPLQGGAAGNSGVGRPHAPAGGSAACALGALPSGPEVPGL